ncbi:MAG: hypothetical protein Q4A66_12100, partial [Eubacteriales bacterium]|nr:hypothetical protein [Eubacteriales bacterium]
MKRTRKGRGSVARQICRWLLLDALLIGVGLVVFALFHHVLPSVGVVVVDSAVESELGPGFAQALDGLQLSATPTPLPTPAPTPSPTPSPTPAPTPTP